MPCKIVKLPNGSTAIVKVARPTPKKCTVPGCQKHALIICDFKLGDGKTCDKPLCVLHAVQVDPQTDYCPDHPR